MIVPRLKLLKELLSEDGTIFISIDDNEQHNLKTICDEIFGELNFAGVFLIKSTPNARDYGHIGKMHEHCYFYANNYDSLKTYLIEDNDKTFSFGSISQTV